MRLSKGLLIPIPHQLFTICSVLFGTVFDEVHGEMSIKLQTLPNGDIVACPMTGYELRTAAEVGLLLVIEYVETAQQLETGERKTLQAMMSPQQALTLAESLENSATVMLTPNARKKVQ
jgi:hypothetical protein